MGIERLCLSEKNVMVEQLKRIADDLLANRRTYAIWGCGNTGRRAHDFLTKYSNGKLVPKYFIDNNRSYWGMDNVVGPDTFIDDMKNIDVVLICVYVADQVQNQLIEIGYKGQIHWVSMSVTIVDQTTIDIYNNNLNSIERMYDMLEDDRSKQTVDAYIRFIQSGDIAVWKNINGNSVYKLIDEDVIDCSANHNYVDVGAFVGDTLDAFVKCSNGKYNSILCIEPDVRNFSQLKAYVENNNISYTTLYNVAVGREDGELCFSGDCSESCTIAEDGKMTIKVVALDNLKEAFDASFIKISTNGYDLNALYGAEHIIKRNRPQIATYASGSLLWEIPLFLKSIVPEYKIYYRHYGIGRQAMICYAKV